VIIRSARQALDDHLTIEHAGHFLQEDAGVELGRVVAGFVQSR
jgi:hypothetical protein